MEQLADSVWMVDGPAVPFYGMPYTTRMVIVRLEDGALWVHSPIQWQPAFKQQLAALGEVKYLIAPNHLHHLFLADWQQQYPEARLYGTAQVQAKRPELTYAGILDETTHTPWQQDIAQLLFTGSKAMQEAVFFHRASCILILTDLIENFSPKHFNPWQRLLARLMGILAPQGQTPLDWRLSFVFGKAQAREHLLRMLSWQPECIVMAHGELVQHDAVAFLRHSFRWLKLPDTAGQHD
ncbi:DUF4336 domain-containing protein [Alkalimonas amylolytica]|uniref:DUF4336 domain-containing protein n=1 Tax=Alkalimonas amylolytica TaxID=152573 RepID=A0A1H3ZFB6_ALKAM|nr:DUF4336 domain-containing protein [Alkalimonas amylolytica]SEA22469.1 protein of unknown function [Alkalimonas amylolytica]